MGHGVTNQNLRPRDSHGHEPYTSQNDAYYAIGLLYAGRGDYQKAKEYFEKNKNKKLLTTLVQDIP